MIKLTMMVDLFGDFKFFLTRPKKCLMLGPTHSHGLGIVLRKLHILLAAFFKAGGGSSCDIGG